LAYLQNAPECWSATSWLGWLNAPGAGSLAQLRGEATLTLPGARAPW